MSKLIRREDVVIALYQAIRTNLTGILTDSMSLAIAMVKNIPTVEPEQKKANGNEEKVVIVGSVLNVMRLWKVMTS